MKTKIKNFFKRKIVIAGLVVLVFIIFFTIKNNGQKGEQAVVARRDIIERVSATGKVKPAQSVELGFDASGRVALVYAKVGDKVEAGNVIAALEGGESSAELSQAKATLLEEQIKLRELRNTAPTSYTNASRNLETVIKDAFLVADNAVRNKADQFFKNPLTNPDFSISITSGNFIHYFNVPADTKIEINSDRRKTEEILKNWSNGANADAAISNLNLTLAFLDKLAYAVNSFTPAEYAYESTVAGYKTTISSARTEVSDAISAVVTAKDKINAAPILGQGGEFENVSIQEAKVEGAQAQVNSLQSIYNKTLIRAPFAGVITKQDAKVGEAVSASSPVISMLSEDQMYIEANISEIHIGKVLAGNLVSITFDAFPGEIFSGTLTYIEPGDVEIDGVVNYKVRVNLSRLDKRIKSGLTSNLKIETSKKENVLAIPMYAVMKENGENFVNILERKKVQKAPVDLGKQGDDGFVEVLGVLMRGM